MSWRDILAKIPVLGRHARARRESMSEAAEAKEASARSLKEATQFAYESKNVQEKLTKIRIENHFAERYGSALRGVADE